MRTLNLAQGSPEWLAHRRTTRNASDAPVMMGVSPNISRRELVKLRATGLDREHSDYVQTHVLDRGHQVEPALRALAEKMLGEDLYPVTGVTDDDYLGASFDGVTLDDALSLAAHRVGLDAEPRTTTLPTTLPLTRDTIPTVTFDGVPATR